MLVATSLVMLITPGLAFFHGGRVGRKNVRTITIQDFASMGISTVIWYSVGFSLCFSGGEGGITGNLDQAFLNGVDPLSGFGDGGIPMLVFVAYQMMFAIITPALITGAFANRVRFGAYLIFLVAWLLLVYFPFVHMIRGNGLLAKWGVLDFAGGIAVHHIAYSFAAKTWLAAAWVLERKPRFVGQLTGEAAGLATMTSAAARVSPASAALIGLSAGRICHFAVSLKNRLRWDDSLEVWVVHGVGGALGIGILGILASTAVSPAGADGLLRGGSTFFMKELVAIVG